jgi:hypothetical protein
LDVWLRSLSCLLVFTFIMINLGRITSCFIVLVHGIMLICLIILVIFLVMIFGSIREMNGRWWLAYARWEAFFPNAVMPLFICECLHLRVVLSYPLLCVPFWLNSVHGRRFTSTCPFGFSSWEGG